MEEKITFIHSTVDYTEYFNTSESTINPTVKWTNEEIDRLIQIIVRPILSVLGTVGNLITVYIMRTTSLKEISSCFYMFILALTDTLVLWTGCLRTWITFLTNYTLDPRQWTDCKMFYFLLRFGKPYSSMLLVLMSMEKCFAVYFPLKSKIVCTVKVAKYATGIVGAVLAGYSVLYFFAVESHVIEGRPSCVYTHARWVFADSVDSILYSFGPFTIMVIANFAIVFKFMRAKCKNNSTESTNQALVKAATRGTAMVLTVSFTFLILTAPTAVNSALWSVNQLAYNPPYRTFMNLTQYLNHSINGVLYIIVGTRFRNELLRLFRRKERSDNTFASHSFNRTSLVSISVNRA